jgi:hypothetical protein
MLLQRSNEGGYDGQGMCNVCGRRLKYRWEDLKELGLNRVSWILLVQDRDKWRALAKKMINT